MVEFGASSMHRWLHCYWRRAHPVPFLDVLLLLIETILVALNFKLSSAHPTNPDQRHMQGPRSPHSDFCYCNCILHNVNDLETGFVSSKSKSKENRGRLREPRNNSKIKRKASHSPMQIFLQFL